MHITVTTVTNNINHSNSSAVKCSLLTQRNPSTRAEQEAQQEAIQRNRMESSRQQAAVPTVDSVLGAIIDVEG